MRLKDWLDAKHMSPAEFAGLVGVERSTVGRWLSGRMPQKVHRDKIREVTGGAVTGGDFVEDEDEDEPRGGGVLPRGGVEGKAA